jgi:hypothetical protein
MYDLLTTLVPSVKDVITLVFKVLHASPVSENSRKSQKALNVDKTHNYTTGFSSSRRVIAGTPPGDFKVVLNLVHDDIDTGKRRNSTNAKKNGRQIHRREMRVFDYKPNDTKYIKFKGVLKYTRNGMKTTLETR